MSDSEVDIEAKHAALIACLVFFIKAAQSPGELLVSQAISVHRWTVLIIQQQAVEQGLIPEQGAHTGIRIELLAANMVIAGCTDIDYFKTWVDESDYNVAKEAMEEAEQIARGLTVEQAYVRFDDAKHAPYAQVDRGEALRLCSRRFRHINVR